jgi:squalene synthase HpnC
MGRLAHRVPDQQNAPPSDGTQLMQAESHAVYEAPSGKGAGDENFPVGSFLLPRALRPHVAVFYAFARAIDDIADNPTLAAADKVARLDAFEQAVRGTFDAPGLEKAIAMRQSLAETGITPQHCCDLISAFKQDAVKGRYANWAELIDYCDRSAAPVGRYLLDLHGELKSDYPPSDALCNALQVINHLQDCAQDYAALDRVYIPLDYLAAEGLGVEVLKDPAASPAFRRVLDRCLVALEPLLAEAKRLPLVLKSRRLALESGAIAALGTRIAARLAKEDPLATRVALSKPAFALAAAWGVAETLARRAA